MDRAIASANETLTASFAIRAIQFLSLNFGFSEFREIWNTDAINMTRTMLCIGSSTLSRARDWHEGGRLDPRSLRLTLASLESGSRGYRSLSRS